MDGSNFNLLESLIAATQRKDKKQGFRNLEDACNYLEREGVAINAGTVSRNLQDKGLRPSSPSSIRNDTNGYMRYVNVRALEQSSKKSRYNKDEPNADNIFNIYHWTDMPHDQVCLTLVTTLVQQRQLRHELNAQKNINRSLQFDPDKFLGIEREVELTNKSISQDLLDDIKEAIRMLSRIASFQVDPPTVSVIDCESQHYIGIFRSKEFMDATEYR